MLEKLEDLFCIAGADENDFLKDIRVVLPDFSHICDVVKGVWGFEYVAVGGEMFHAESVNLRGVLCFKASGKFGECFGEGFCPESGFK